MKNQGRKNAKPVGPKVVEIFDKFANHKPMKNQNQNSKG